MSKGRIEGWEEDKKVELKGKYVFLKHTDIYISLLSTSAQFMDP